MPDTRPRKHAKQSDTAADNGSHAGEESLPLWEKISDKILESINKRFDHLEHKFEDLMSTQLALTERIVATEEQGTDHERRILTLERCLSDLEKSNGKLLTKIDDLEGRARRNNVKIVGIPEDEEKGKPTDFVTELIPKLLGVSNFAKPVIVDRAHRIPVPKPTEDKKPRSIIARIHFYQQKELILRLSRQQQMTYNGRRVFIFPDYTAEVMAQRRGFRQVIQALKEREVKFTLRFPAKLYVHNNDQVKVFTSPGEAMSFIEHDMKR